MSFVGALVGVVLAAGVRVLLDLWAPAARVVDPFLVVAVVCGLTLGRVQALFAGLLSGLVHDTWWSGWFGLHGFTKVVIAYAASALGTRLDLSQSVPRVVALGVASAADRAFQLLLGAAMGRAVAAPPAREWLLAAAAAMALGLLVFVVVDRIAARP